MKLIADRDACIGSGNCMMVSEELFDADDDGVVVLLVSLLVLNRAGVIDLDRHHDVMSSAAPRPDIS